jgi:hypothetical protein
MYVARDEAVVWLYAKCMQGQTHQTNRVIIFVKITTTLVILTSLKATGKRGCRRRGGHVAEQKHWGN